MFILVVFLREPKVLPPMHVEYLIYLYTDMKGIILILIHIGLFVSLFVLKELLQSKNSIGKTLQTVLLNKKRNK